MAETLDDLLALKQRKQIALERKKEKIQDLNNYFSENKYRIIWAQLNPLEEGTQNKINSYLEVIEGVLPEEITGSSLLQTAVGKSSVKGVGILLARTALKLFMDRFAHKKAKRKRKKKSEKIKTEEA